MDRKCGPDLRSVCRSLTVIHLWLSQQSRQLGDIGRHPPRLVEACLRSEGD